MKSNFPDASAYRRRDLLATMVAASFVVALAGCDEAKPSFHSIDVTGVNYAQALSLKDFDGKVRTLAEFKGKVVVVFFGYTQCPDVCPTTMTRMLEVKKLLGDKGDRLQVIFITLDPERDTAEILKAYLGSFDPGFLALIPTMDELPDLAKNFKVYYKKVPSKTPGNYSMDHTAASFVYDPKGLPRLYTRPESDNGAAALAADIKILLDGR
jgi:protein SCO1/2